MQRLQITRVGTVLALVAVAGMLGAHWPVLKSIAWGRMLVTYSSDYGLRAGIVRTFNGRNPCAMCCAIKRGQAEERAPSASINQTVSSERGRALTTGHLAVILPLAKQIQVLPGPRTYCSHDRESPPVPPPRPRLPA